MRMVMGFLVLTLTACVNNYSKFYTAQPHAAEIVASKYTEKTTKDPMFIGISEANANATFLDLRRHGYVLIGVSSFYAPAAKTSNDQAIEQAKKIGAAVVTVGMKYHDTLSGTNQFMLPGAPVTSTVNTTGNINGYNYNANSTVTTPGEPTTINVPYRVDRNDFWAGYWVHQATDKFKFGAQMADLPAPIVQKLHRNTGVYVAIVVAGTPAFTANILDGDVITKINGQDVVDRASFRDKQLAQFSGQTVTLDIIRGDENLSLKVPLR